MNTYYHLWKNLNFSGEEVAKKVREDLLYEIIDYGLVTELLMWNYYCDCVGKQAQKLYYSRELDRSVCDVEGPWYRLDRAEDGVVVAVSDPYEVIRTEEIIDYIIDSRHGLESPSLQSTADEYAAFLWMKAGEEKEENQ